MGIERDTGNMSTLGEIPDLLPIGEMALPPDTTEEDVLICLMALNDEGEDGPVTKDELAIMMYGVRSRWAIEKSQQVRRWVIAKTSGEVLRSVREEVEEVPDPLPPDPQPEQAPPPPIPVYQVPEISEEVRKYAATMKPNPRPRRRGTNGTTPNRKAANGNQGVHPNSRGRTTQPVAQSYLSIGHGRIRKDSTWTAIIKSGNWPVQIN
jgi:hypothetical protein